MGKTKGSGKNVRGNNGLRGINGIGRKRDELEENSMEQVDQDVIKKIEDELKRGTSDEKESALHNLTMVLSHRSGSVFSGNSPLIRMVAPLIVDPQSSMGVRHGAVGVLKNMSLISADACDEMVKQDVMTPLCALFTQHYSDPENDLKEDPKKSPSSARKEAAENDIEFESEDTKSEVFVQAVNLLWNLCEASEIALSIADRYNLPSLLISYLECEGTDTEARIAILQCLYSMSEENKQTAKMVEKNFALFETFFSLGSSKTASYACVLSIGIVLNAASCLDEAPIREELWPKITHVLASVLDVDQRKLVNDFTSDVPLLLQASVRSKKKSAKDQESKGDAEPMEDIAEEQPKLVGRPEIRIAKLRVEIVEVIQAQQTALEILTNMCCSKEEEWQDEDDDEQEEDMEDLDGSEVMVDESETISSNSLLSTLPSSLADSLQNADMFKRVLEKANLPPENVCQILREDKEYGGRSLLRHLTTLRSRAFMCINNLVSELSKDSEDILFETWTLLGRLCFSPEISAGQKNPDFELLDSATSAMRAIIQKLKDIESGKLAGISASDLSTMIEFGTKSTEPSVRANVVEMTGLIGLFSVTRGASSPTSQETALCIGQFLLESCARDTSLRVAAEALDKIFDMFAEDDTDNLALQLGLVQKMKAVLPGFKVKMSQQRKSLGEEHYPIAQMAKQNLVRFIKYKEKRPVLKR